MRHLPNLLTLCNLFCGCIAISFILAAQNFHTGFDLFEYVEVPAVEQPYWGSFFIFLAAFFDLLDGWAARALKIDSPIGKDLDSLADVVSFGVAPAMILFKLLWTAHIIQPDALDIPLLLMAPAFLVACFAALRLARFNQGQNQDRYAFQGLPTPAAGLLVASFPLIVWQNPAGLSSYLYKPWVLYAVIALLSWLMVSNIRFFKLLPVSWHFRHLWYRLVLVGGTLLAIPFVGAATVTVAFLLYFLLSLFIRQPEATIDSSVNNHI